MPLTVTLPGSGSSEEVGVRDLAGHGDRDVAAGCEVAHVGAGGHPAAGGSGALDRGLSGALRGGLGLLGIGGERCRPGRAVCGGGGVGLRLGVAASGHAQLGQQQHRQHEQRHLQGGDSAVASAPAAGSTRPDHAGSPSRGAEADALTETGIPGTSCSDWPVTVTVTRPPLSLTVTPGEMSTPEPICEAADIGLAGGAIGAAAHLGPRRHPALRGGQGDVVGLLPERGLAC